ASLGGSDDEQLRISADVWGAPTSRATYDRNSPRVIYQRFQRGVMRFDMDCGCTQAVNVADYFKALLTGDSLPDDLASEAAQSPFLRQYAPGLPGSIARPEQLPDSDLTDAFAKTVPPAIAGGPSGGPSTVVAPTTAPDWTTSDSWAPNGVAAVQPGSGNSAAAGAGLQYGLNVFTGGKRARVFQQVRDLSFGWQKSLIRWRDVEGAGKGRFDWSSTDDLVQASQAAGLHMLARVDFQPGWARADGANNGPPDNYQDYADFLFALITRYRAGSPHGHIDAVEIWNEVNISREWGGRPINQQQAASYVRLLSAAYDAVKRADPSVTVVSAGLSPTGSNTEQAKPDDVYLQWLYDAGMAGHYDALGVHAPGFKAPPEVSPDQAAADPGWGRHRSFTFRRVEDIRAIMERNGEAGRPIWVTEFGWTSDTVNADYRWFAVTEDAKADYLVRALRWAREHWSGWIGPMFVWNLPDEGWGPRDEMFWWSISDPDGTPRAAYLALRDARRNGSLP
ncbi:MAG TPA: hypothetical protein VM347_18775, partial [Nonomuraea sp.]|nr:hypothetical protein [Nonomuraea sp.]